MLELLGQVILPTGLMYENTEVGGLSGISYASGEDSYYVISDDRSLRQPARFYRLNIDILENKVKNSSVKITGVTLLQNEEGKTFKLKLVGGLANSIFQGNTSRSFR